MIAISYFDCCRDLLDRAGRPARDVLADWRARSGYGHVVAFVENFTHRYLFALSPNDVRNVIRNSTHALGNVKAEEQLDYIEDFTTPFAFQHLFHWYIEHNRGIPTWKQFRDWMVEGPAAPCWYVPLKEYLEHHYPRGDRRAWSRAARWRLGKVYLSNMRELDLLARLREAGIPIRYHVLADVLFRVDFWAGDVLVCTYFPNSSYRDGSEAGRKPPAERYFADANPPFKIVHVPIERQGFGKIWLTSNDSVVRLVETIKSRMVS
ncbi:hypothetical protein [Burkholderia ubonensis]|uniref:hypothetical protein n=1 Tax=Burkholderia ubonensis TaxID=101571 RepID=UPI000A79186C|nr:hypothetical protein [Burkholderia ubonensis]